VVGSDPSERRWCGELARPTSMTGGLTSSPVLEEEAMMATLSPGLDGNERRQRWLVMASRAVGGSRDRSVPRTKGNGG
jgi:hypothetical protein